MQRTMRMLSPRGDDTLATYESGVTSPEELQKIETEFKEKIKAGYFAADITDQKDVIIHDFDPNADILLIPRLQGGSR